VKKRIIACLLLACLLLFSCAAFAYGETAKAMDSGYLRLPFDNGYNGFCIAHHAPQADMDDVYLVCSTDKAVNNMSGENIANYLKVFATQFSDIFLGDNVYAQQYIWHFSDDFNGWRINPDVVQEIRDLSMQMIIPAHGYVTQVDDVTRIWDFMVLDEADGDAIFFAYKYTDVGESGQGVAIPQTGDETNFALWTALALVSAACMTMMLRRRKEI